MSPNINKMYVLASNPKHVVIHCGFSDYHPFGIQMIKYYVITENKMCELNPWLFFCKI